MSNDINQENILKEKKNFFEKKKKKVYPWVTRSSRRNILVEECIVVLLLSETTMTRVSIGELIGIKGHRVTSIISRQTKNSKKADVIIKYVNDTITKAKLRREEEGKVFVEPVIGDASDYDGSNENREDQN